MESRELLCRIKAGDDEAFRTMVLTYRKPVYLRLLERSGNKEVAKEALREALIDLYITVKMANSKDPVEALLYSRAEEIKRADVQPSDIPIQVKAEKRPWSAGRLAAAIALSAGILAALWVIAGLLMDMGFLPDIDMGYSWFNMNIAPWF